MALRSDTSVVTGEIGRRGGDVLHTREGGPFQRRFGRFAAIGVVVLSAAYLIPLAMGFLTLPSPNVPFVEPWYSMMEVLILLIAPFMVALSIAIHLDTPLRLRSFTLVSVVFTGITATITTCVHFIVLTLSRRPDFASFPWLDSLLSFRWPSVTYALDILAWDVMFPVSILVLIPVFGGTRVSEGVRILLGASGLLCLAGLAGLVVDDMQVRNIGIVGYAVVYPLAAVLLARHFRRGADAGVTRPMSAAPSAD